MGYQFFLPMVLCWRASRAEAPLESNTVRPALTNIILSWRHLITRHYQKCSISFWLKTNLFAMKSVECSNMFACQALSASLLCLPSAKDRTRVSWNFQKYLNVDLQTFAARKLLSAKFYRTATCPTQQRKNRILLWPSPPRSSIARKTRKI